MTISILGCGWYGLPLAKALAADGHTVKGSTTTEGKVAALEDAGIRPFLIDLSSGQALPQLFFDADLLIIAIPPKSRSGEGEAYIIKLRKVLEEIIQHNIKQVILISSTGVYADQNRVVDEFASPEPDTPSGQILLQAEELFRGQSGFKTTIIRFGGLVGPDRDPGRFFAGKTGVANGLAPVNLIHLDDCIGITRSVISQRAYGLTINAVAPHHPTRIDFYTQAAAKSNLALPEFVLQLDKWKIVESKISAQELSYSYYVNNWYNWLNG